MGASIVVGLRPDARRMVPPNTNLRHAFSGKRMAALFDAAARKAAGPRIVRKLDLGTEQRKFLVCRVTVRRINFGL
jgi:hypothetical protein